ncbi:MAG TPA: sulfatase [Thermoanaerobaculia bacterium]|nr:sulfatase [Thermoanaerobaculia bacterium]
MRRILPVLAALLFWSLAGCHRQPEVRLLLDGNHVPDVLTEQRRIAEPPSLSGNRFLSGWWPWSNDGRLVLSPPRPRATVRLEVVNLGRGPRTLLLDLLQAAPGRSARVRAAGRDLGAFPLTDPLQIPLPAGLPLGRVPVDLEFDWGSRGVLAAGMRPTLPAGKVRLEGEDVLQSGDSLVDFVRRVSGGETLVGTFAPPRSPGSGQRFELILEREPGRPLQRLSWSAKELRERRIALSVGDGPGFVRVRLLARGGGATGRWERLGLIGGRKNAEPPETIAEVSPSPPAAPRLVILYVMDALRADAVGHLGGMPGASPTYDRLAREGVTFKHHRSVAPNTIPSTKALFTGRTFVTNGDWSLDPGEGTTLAERFRRAGYRTGLFSGNVYVSSSYGTDRGFEHVATEVLMDADGAGRGSLNDNAARAHAAAVSWLETLPPGDPAFLYFHTIHPHNPYAPPNPYQARFTRGIRSSIDGSTETLVAVRKGEIAPGPADRERLRGLYRGSFAFNDAELGRFLRRVSKLVPPSEILVVLTSDHGEELFDHGGVLHGYTLYEELLDIPLVLWWPGRLRPGVVEEPTDTLDLHASLVELCGLGKPDGDGRPLLRQPPRTDGYIHLAAASSVIGGIYSAQAGRWKLVWAPRYAHQWGMGDGSGRSRDPEYLFDLGQDPRERVNLAGDGSLEVAWLRSRLLAWIQRNRSEEPPRKQQAPIDAETERRLRALGYGNVQ